MPGAFCLNAGLRATMTVEFAKTRDLRVCLRFLRTTISTIPSASSSEDEVNQSINLLLFLQKQNLATAMYLFGLGTLLT
jgi:hypothetical protein